MSDECASPKPKLIQGLWPHEIAYLLLLSGALYCSFCSQYHTEKWPQYVYEAAFLAALPVLWHRCREEWRQLPNRGFFLALTLVWTALFQWQGLSTFQVLGSRSLFGWLFNVYSSPFVDEEQGMLIPFVVLLLVWWKRRELAVPPRGLWWPGLGLVAAGLMLHVSGFIVQQPRLSVIGCFTGLYGLMGMAWGPGWLKAIFFPYFLLVFCVPLGALGEVVTLRLRIWVATIVAGISQLGLAPDVLREGTQLFDAQHTFAYEVAPACSGIRSVMAMLALTTIYGFLAFKPAWKRLLMVALAVPLAVLGNVVRLCLTIMVTEVLGQGAGTAVESKLGFVTFAVGIGCILVVSRWLESSEGPPAGQAPPDAGPITGAAARKTSEIKPAGAKPLTP
jgi:exosortase